MPFPVCHAQLKARLRRPLLNERLLIEAHARPESPLGCIQSFFDKVIRQSCCYSQSALISRYLLPSFTHLRRRSHRSHHPLQQLQSCLLARLSEANAHVLQKRGMADEARQRVALDVRSPFVLGCICGPDTDVARLERLELLLCAEFIGHDRCI